MYQKHLVVLTGERINEGFLQVIMYGRFVGWPKKIGRNNEVTVLPRWPLDEV